MHETDRLGPSQAALLVVDMQNGFCSPDGSFTRLAGAIAHIDDVIAGVNRAVSCARTAGVPVVFTRHVYQRGYPDAPRTGDPGMAAVMAMDGLLADTWDADLIEDIARQPTDPVITKCRPDAFYETSLHSLLRCLGVEDLRIVGVTTNICVESTARAAYMRDFRVTVFADACGGVSAEDHRVALELLQRYGLARIGNVSDW